MNADLKLAFESIIEKQKDHTEKFNYYDGQQPLVYLTYRLREIFQGLDIEFMDNWCAVVIDAVKERINLTGLNVPKAHQNAMNKIWTLNELNLEADEVHESALVTGEAFMIAWPDEKKMPKAYYNDPRLCHSFYHSDNPRELRMAAKMWVDDDGYYRLTLYYPDRLEYYASTQKADQVSSHKSFKAMETPSAKNPYGKIPVFHFRLERRGRKSDLTSVIPLQRGVNKLLNDMMVAAEFGAFKQRYVISQVDVSRLKNAPNEVWSIPGSDGTGQGTEVGEFGATPLQNYIEAIDKLAGDMGRITRTPKHYFYHQGGDPSGEALIAQEAPLNKKAQDRIEKFSSVWRRLGSFLLELKGINVNPMEITPVWDPVETVQPRTQAEIRLLDRQSGIPLITVCRRSGWPQVEIDQMLQEAEADVEGLGERILSAFDKGK
ncbi:hypothetical protein ADN00_18865 [Ornatilinea apprima]|uniref:Phage portal protein n=1 Tax=Ornatilinea apprima TaxID=1134406 RepID=A0A0P6WVX6_9CHLR|nr:phage portal protein [Ornatilinea apprima]KPL70105.1 hypothetical protein ADN00_18865 [Ornatilinea apprima]